VIGLACVSPVPAQEKPDGRPDLSGTWTLDVHLSDKPTQVARAIRIDTGLPAEEELIVDGREGGRAGGSGRAGAGRGEPGGPGRDRRGAADKDPISPEDRKKLNELTDAVRFASPTLTIAQSDTDVTITSTRGGTQTLHVNGKAEKQALNAGTVDRIASWEGPTLVVAYDVGRAGALTYTYLIVPTTRQLMVRVNFERIRGQPGPFDIKLVYNRATRP
jgi:hypothetical protein